VRLVGYLKKKAGLRFHVELHQTEQTTAHTHTQTQSL